VQVRIHPSGIGDDYARRISSRCTLYFCLTDRMFCNPLVVYGWYVLISIIMVILRMTVLYIYWPTSSPTSELLKFKCFV